MIAPLIKWDHTEDYYVTKFSLQKGDYSGERKVTLSLEEESYIAGHIIDGRLINSSKIFMLKNINCVNLNKNTTSILLNITGRIIVPGTTYLQLVWETLAMMTKGAISPVINVEFEDVRFLRATTMGPGQKIDFTVMVPTYLKWSSSVWNLMS